MEKRLVWIDIIKIFLFIGIKSTTQKKISEEKEHTVIYKWASLGMGLYLFHPMLLPLIVDFHGICRFIGVIEVYLCAAIINLVISFTPLKKLFLRL